MHNQIEPALAAFQIVWAANPDHRRERPNPTGQGPLAADCLTYLDLAYLRLFVSLGRSKEAFWQRDFDEMAREIAKGYDIVQHADHSPGAVTTDGQSYFGRNDVEQQMLLRRERHLRKAAYHAAHALQVADQLGNTFADFNSRELPISAAMATFDCAQVLAEWAAIVQERVGQHVGGVLGRDPIDFNIESNPAIILLEQEDIELMMKIEEILHGAEIKMTNDVTGRFSSGNDFMTGSMLPHDGGYSSRILVTVARMLDNSSVWPGK